MHFTIRKIGILILAVIIMPVLIFSLFAIGNLRHNEKVIHGIYKNQLDAILFSINQYSDDIMNNLASRIEIVQNNQNSNAEYELNMLINQIPSVKSLVMFNVNLKYILSVPNSYRDSIVPSEMTTILSSQDTLLKRLNTYMERGYRKIETIGSSNRSMQLIVFLSNLQNEDVINVLVIDPEKFISQVLDPKIQEISRGKFHIVAYRAGEDSPFYTSNKQYNSVKFTNKRPFWLLKNYLMGIELKGITIDDLARNRTKRNILLIGIVDIILLFGAWLIFRNVKNLVELSQLKSDFVSNVSHEIRTPLSLIKMYVETLEMKRVKNTQKINEYYNVILNETNRLSGIVNRILSFSQIENTKKGYSFSDSDINEIVDHVMLNLQYTIENKGFQFSFELDKNLPFILVDREAVADAFVNLIDNAMKYSNGNKNIAVRTGKYDTYVYFEVEDHGIGISQKQQKHIFEKFYRVTEQNLTNKVQGSGLGLAIIKHIMDAHEGKVYVRSSPGSGSLFRLLFPVK